MIYCKNCKAPLQGKYCSACGQKNYTEKDKTVKHLLEEAFHFMTHFEGAFFTTLKSVFLRPGQMTVDYCDGSRKKYFKPISFYLLIVVLYLVFPLFKGLNMEMAAYKTIMGGKIISRQIEHKMQAENISEQELSEHFEVKSHTVAKFLLLILIPVSALVVSLLFFRQRIFYDNLILATELNIFYLLGMFLLLPVIILLLRKAGLFLFHSEDLLAFIITSLFTIYCAVVFHRVFRAAWGIVIIKSILFSLLHLVFGLMIYKFLVFEATFLLL